MIPSFSKPQKQLVCSVRDVSGNDYWKTPFGDNDKTWEGGESPRYNSWKVSLSIASMQEHGYPYSTTPFRYTGLDINMGGFISRSSSGMVYRVKEVISKSRDSAEIIVEDIYRINDFSFNGSVSINPSVEPVLYFEVDDNFSASINVPQISASIPAGVVHYIDTYIDKISFIQYPVLCCDETMEIGDIVSVENDKFVRATKSNFDKVIGRVYMSTGTDNEYVINPVHDYKKMDTDIGVVGDIVYLSDDGQTLTTTPTMKPIYLKVMESVPNVSTSRVQEGAHIPAGSTILINDVEMSFPTQTTLAEFANMVNTLNVPYLSANTSKTPFSITNESNYEYGLLGIMDLPSVITINGYEITISTVTAGRAQYDMDVAIGEDIVKDITDSGITDITASYSSASGRITLTNSTGGDIIISNVSGGKFASDTGTSGTGFKETNIAPEGAVVVNITHSLGKEILIRDIGLETFTSSSGIASSDNGIMPRGIYYGNKVRTGSNYVVESMIDVDSVNPYIGDSVHVKDSGNGEWVEMKYTSDGWITIATEDSARTDADTLSKVITFNDTGSIYIGTVSGNSRISNISVTVNEPFDDDTAVINIGDATDNKSLISNSFIDIMSTGVYANTPSKVYETETELYAYVNGHTSTTGEIKVVISYM